MIAGHQTGARLGAMTKSEAEYIGLQEASEYLGVSVLTLRRRIADKTLPAYRVGPRAIRVRKADLNALAKPLP